MATATLHELSDDEWEAERNAVTQRFFGIDAADFVTRFNEGEFQDTADGLMQTLMLFPELR